MKCTVPRFGRTAVCIGLGLALCCGCSVLPPASGKPAASTASTVPTDASGKPLYDSSRLEDGRLRILYGYDNSGNSSTVLCGGRVLYQSARSENVYLLQDTVTGETNYWFRNWSDPAGRGGRRSALYDKDGAEVLTFDGQQSATMQNGLLVLQESRMLGDSYLDGYDSYGTCQVIDPATGESLPVPEGAYACVVCSGRLVYTCYARPAGLADDEWDDDASLHSWVVVLTRDGTQVYRADTSTAYRISYLPDELSDWVELDTYHADGAPVEQMLYNPVTGEGFAGYTQTCGNGTACFTTADGRYELRDMTAEDRGVIGTFDDMPSSYFPGYVTTWRTGSDYGYDLHDLVSGEVTPLNAASTTNDTITLYYKDGRLKVFSTVTGEIITDTSAGTLESGQTVRLDSEDNGYVWLEVLNDSYDTLSTRVYGPEGLVSDLTALQSRYSTLNYLTTTPEGRPLYYGQYGGSGSYSGLVDVLDETGNITLRGLAQCYSYYSNSLNGLPDHVFVARRGFYCGWMDTDGNWLYCQNIFSSINADDELGW